MVEYEYEYGELLQETGRGMPQFLTGILGFLSAQQLHYCYYYLCIYNNWKIR
jgi:hypothetical protein